MKMPDCLACGWSTTEPDTKRNADNHARSLSYHRTYCEGTQVSTEEFGVRYTAYNWDETGTLVPSVVVVGPWSENYCRSWAKRMNAKDPRSKAVLVRSVETLITTPWKEVET